MSQAVTPTRFIRVHIFQMTQKQFADFIAESHVIDRPSQPTISRWEKDGMFPSDVQKYIRVEAKQRNLRWEDRLFFEVPEWAFAEGLVDAD